MTLVITAIGLGAAEGDGTGDKARVGGTTINDNFTNTKTAVEELQGRFWTVDNTARTLALGECIVSGSHAGITHTLQATFAISATSLSDVWVWNADSNSNVTLAPDGTDEIFLTGIGQGAGVAITLSPGQIAICFPRVTDVSWNVIVITDWSSGQATAPITTTGALTCGALTSTGFDDNASGERCQLADSDMGLGITGTSSYALVRIGTTGALALAGGDSISDGGNIKLYGSGHATKANDIELRSGTNNRLVYNDSAAIWDFRKNTLTWNYTSEDLPFFNFVMTIVPLKSPAANVPFNTCAANGALIATVPVDVPGAKVDVTAWTCAGESMSTVPWCRVLNVALMICASVGAFIAMVPVLVPGENAPVNACRCL